MCLVLPMTEAKVGPQTKLKPHGSPASLPTLFSSLHLAVNATTSNPTSESDQDHTTEAGEIQRLLSTHKAQQHAEEQERRDQQRKVREERMAKLASQKALDTEKASNMRHLHVAYKEVVDDYKNDSHHVQLQRRTEVILEADNFSVEGWEQKAARARDKAVAWELARRNFQAGALHAITRKNSSVAEDTSHQEDIREARVAEEAEDARVAGAARLAEEKEASRKAAEEERARKAAKEAEAARIAEEARLAEEQDAVRKAAEEERARKAAEEAEAARISAEKRLAEEKQASRKAAEEERARKAAEEAEAARISSEKRLAEEKQASRKAAEEERARKAAEEAEAARISSEKRLAEEKQASRKAAEEERARKAAEEAEAARISAEKRLAEEKEAASKAAEDERARKAADEAEAARISAEKRLAEEKEAARKAAEDERARKAEEAEAARLFAEQEERRRVVAESQLKAVSALLETGDAIGLMSLVDSEENFAQLLQDLPDMVQQETVGVVLDSAAELTMNAAETYSKSRSLSEKRFQMLEARHRRESRRAFKKRGSLKM